MALKEENGRVWKQLGVEPGSFSKQGQVASFFKTTHFSWASVLNIGNPVSHWCDGRGEIPSSTHSWVLSAAGGPCKISIIITVMFCFIQQQGEAHESGDAPSLPIKKKKNQMNLLKKPWPFSSQTCTNEAKHRFKITSFAVFLQWYPAGRG